MECRQRTINMCSRWILTTAACLYLSLSAPAAAYLPPPYGGMVFATLPDRPVTLDPAQATRASELAVIPLLYDSLFRLDHRGVPRPHLLERKPQISADGKIWRLRLRAGIALVAGSRLEADHVVASLRRMRQGANGYLLAHVSSLVAEGKDVVVVSLRRRSPDLPHLLAAPATAIVVPRGRRLLGTGPYRLLSKDRTMIQLQSNNTHFAGRPYLHRLSFRMFARASTESAWFQVGALQFSHQGTPVFGGPARRPSRTISSPPVEQIYLGVGSGKAFLADAQFRLALLTGIDRRRLARLVGSGKAPLARSPVATRLMRRLPRAVAFNRGAAKRLLQRAAARHPGLADKLSGGRLKLSLLVDASRFGDAILAGQIVADLDRIGVTCTIDRRAAVDYRTRLRARRFDLVLGRQALQVPLGGVALAGAHAAAGDRDSARSCMMRYCGSRQAARFMKQLPLIPLLHAPARVQHDARMGVRLDPAGRVLYENVYWLRKVP